MTDRHRPPFNPDAPLVYRLPRRRHWLRELAAACAASVTGAALILAAGALMLTMCDPATGAENRPAPCWPDETGRAC